MFIGGFLTVIGIGDALVSRGGAGGRGAGVGWWCGPFFFVVLELSIVVVVVVCS